MEGIMGVFRFGTKAERQTSLDELAALIDCSNADRVLASLYKAVKGEKAWPPLVRAIYERIELIEQARVF
jgi:hypothetical protein